MSKAIDQLYTLKTIAADHIKNGKYSDAIVYLKDILNKFERDLHLITQENQMEKAIRELQIASHKNLSLCYLKERNFIACIDNCKKVLEIEPNNLKILYRIGKAYIELQNYQTAEHYLKRGFYLDSQEKEIMKALQEIQQIRNEREKEDRRSKWSIVQLVKWIITIILTIVSYPFTRSSNSQGSYQKAAKHAQ